MWLTFCCTRYVPNPVDTLMEKIELHGLGSVSSVTFAKGKIVAGDPVELNVLNLPKPKDLKKAGKIEVGRLSRESSFKLIDPDVPVPPRQASTALNGAPRSGHVRSISCSGPNSSHDKASASKPKTKCSFT